MFIFLLLDGTRCAVSPKNLPRYSGKSTKNMSRGRRGGDGAGESSGAAAKTGSIEVKETDRGWRENPKKREKRVPVRRGSKRGVRLTHWHGKSPLLTSRGGTCECVLWSWTATASVRSAQVAAAAAVASVALRAAPARAADAVHLGTRVKSETRQPFCSASSALQHVGFPSIIKHMDGIVGVGGSLWLAKVLINLRISLWLPLTQTQPEAGKLHHKEVQSNRRWKMWLPSNKDSAAASTCSSGEGRSVGEGGGAREGWMDGWIIDKMLLWCTTTSADGSNDTNPNLCA